jgi:hypothetical protein
LETFSQRELGDVARQMKTFFLIFELAFPSNRYQLNDVKVTC